MAWNRKPSRWGSGSNVDDLIREDEVTPDGEKVVQIPTMKRLSEVSHDDTRARRKTSSFGQRSKPEAPTTTTVVDEDGTARVRYNPRPTDLSAKAGVGQRSTGGFGERTRRDGGGDGLQRTSEQRPVKRRRVPKPNEDGEVRSSEVRAQREASKAAAHARREAAAAAAEEAGSNGTPPAKTRLERAHNPLSYVMWLLARRDYSEKELRDKLRQKENTPEVIDATLAKVQSLGYQSDQRFADVQARQRSNRSGDRRLRMELTNKGVDAETVASAMENLPSEKVRAFEAMGRFRGKNPDAALQQKAYRFLAGRGFSFDSIKFAWTRSFGKDAVDHLDEVDLHED